MILRNSLAIIITSLLLSGCVSDLIREVPSDIASSTVTATGIALGAAAPLAVVSGIAAGAVVEQLEPEEGVDLAQVTNVHQEEVAKTQVQADLYESLGTQGVVGAVGAFIFYTIFTWWIGARRARPEEHAAKAKAYEMERLVTKLTDKVASMKEV